MGFETMFKMSGDWGKVIFGLAILAELLCVPALIALVVVKHKRAALLVAPIVLGLLVVGLIIAGAMGASAASADFDAYRAVATEVSLFGKTAFGYAETLPANLSLAGSLVPVSVIVASLLKWKALAVQPS